MKNRTWVLLFAAVILLCAAFLLLAPRGGEQVGVFQNGEQVYTIDTAAIREPYELRLSYEAGESVIHVGPDGIWIVSADCANGDCVRHGPLTRRGTPIVCLPERIVIRYLRDGESGVDAVSG